MKDVFESIESELDELEKQNDLLKDQLLEASLKHDVELCVLLNHECVDKILSDELDQVKKKSFEIQEGLQSRIKILKKGVQRCQKQSVDFELKLQNEKEKHKWDSTLRNKNTNPLDYSWISKLEKLENENVSLDFKVQSLIKERDNVKIEYQKLFDSIKKTRSQTQKEMDELIVHVSEKTYAYGAIRAENQDLLSTISELKIRLEKVEKGVNTTSRVRRPMSKDSSVTNSVLVNSKKATKNVSVYVRKNKQKNNTSANVISNKENVIAVDVTNASKAKTLLCVSYMQNVLIPCHDKFFKSKIDVESASKAKDKVVQIVLWVVDSGCSKHMTGDRSLLRNFIEKFMGASLDLVDCLPKFKCGKDHLCSACERGKSKKASHPPKLVPSDYSKLELLHMDLCGPMRVASINGKKYILVTVDDFPRYT
ncbi:retrovirus-related pol polyprotein from transposon TNT 1-94 [Tanacetum coccineum]